jgi:hypothetical protein
MILHLNKLQTLRWPAAVAYWCHDIVQIVTRTSPASRNTTLNLFWKTGKLEAVCFHQRIFQVVKAGSLWVTANGTRMQSSACEFGSEDHSFQRGPRSRMKVVQITVRDEGSEVSQRSGSASFQFWRKCLGECCIKFWIIFSVFDFQLDSMWIVANFIGSWKCLNIAFRYYLNLNGLDTVIASSGSKYWMF